MNITLELPDEVAVQLQTKWSNLERGILEAIAVEGYRQELLGRSDVEMLLDIPYHKANQLLRERGCRTYITPEEFELAAVSARKTSRSREED